MKILIDISKDKYDKIMSMDWKNRYFYDEELKAIHDGKVLEQEPKMGQWEWKPHPVLPYTGNWYCSECNLIGMSVYDYCPNCGCKMQEVQESEVNNDD